MSDPNLSLPGPPSKEKKNQAWVSEKYEVRDCTAHTILNRSSSVQISLVLMTVLSAALKLHYGRSDLFDTNTSIPIVLLPNTEEVPVRQYPNLKRVRRNQKLEDYLLICALFVRMVSGGLPVPFGAIYLRFI